MAQTILHDGEHILVLAHLDEKQRRRAQSRLFETRRIEIEPGQRPQHPAAALRRRAGRDADREQRGGRIVCERRRRRGEFMEAAERQPATRQSGIHRLDAEGQDLALATAHGAHRVTQTRQGFGTGGGGRHDCCDSYVRYMFRLFRRPVKALRKRIEGRIGTEWWRTRAVNIAGQDPITTISAGVCARWRSVPSTSGPCA